MTPERFREILDEINEADLEFLKTFELQWRRDFVEFMDKFKVSELPAFLDRHCGFLLASENTRNSIIENIGRFRERHSRLLRPDSLDKPKNNFNLDLPWFSLIDESFELYRQMMEEFPNYWVKLATESLISRLNEFYQIKEFKDFSEMNDIDQLKSDFLDFRLIERRLDWLRCDVMPIFSKYRQDSKRVKVPKNKKLITKVLVKSAFTDGFKDLLLLEYNTEYPSMKIEVEPVRDWTSYLPVNFDPSDRKNLRRVQFLGAYLFFLSRPEIMKKMFSIDVRGDEKVVHYDSHLLSTIFFLCSQTYGGRDIGYPKMMTLSENLVTVKNVIQGCFAN